MIVGCRGHCATAAEALQKNREQQLADPARADFYWFTDAIGSSFWPYYARMHSPWPIPAGETVNAPVGYAEFPKEILAPPRSLAEKTYTDIRKWTVIKKGRHFAAMGRPEGLEGEVREFLAAVQ